MDSAEVIAHANRLILKLRDVESAHRSGFSRGLPSVAGLQAQIVDLVRSFAGVRSPFADSAVAASEGADNYRANLLVSVLEAFIDQIEAGMLAAVSPERQAQLDVVSDLLDPFSRAGTCILLPQRFSLAPH